MGGLSAFSQLLAPASANGPGFLTTSAQSFAGLKTARDGMIFGRQSGGTYNGNIQIVPSDQFPNLTFSSATSQKAVITCDASAGGLYIDAVGTINFRKLPGLTTTATLNNSGVFNPTGGVAVGASGTTLTQVKAYTQTITPASVAANTTAEQTFTVTGLTTADKVSLNPGAAPTAGTGIAGVRVSAADTLAVTYSNNTAGALTPVSSTCQILATRS